MAFLVLMEWRKDFYTATRGREDHEHRENDFDKHDHGIFSVPEEKSKPPVNMSPKIKHILEDETSQQIEHGKIITRTKKIRHTCTDRSRNL